MQISLAVTDSTLQLGQGLGEPELVGPPHRRPRHGRTKADSTKLDVGENYAQECVAKLAEVARLSAHIPLSE